MWRKHFLILDVYKYKIYETRILAYTHKIRVLWSRGSVLPLSTPFLKHTHILLVFYLPPNNPPAVFAVLDAPKRPPPVFKLLLF